MAQQADHDRRATAHINVAMIRCSQELREVVGSSREPYRVVCNQLAEDLEATIEMLQVSMLPMSCIRCCVLVLQF